jgi:hypothetical protein
MSQNKGHTQLTLQKPSHLNCYNLLQINEKVLIGNCSRLKIFDNHLAKILNVNNPTRIKYENYHQHIK